MSTLTFQAALGGSVNLVGPNTSSTLSWTLPNVDGSASQPLVTNGSGVLSFSNAPALGTPVSGTIGACTIDGTNAVGYLGIPINSQSNAYTMVLSDAGKCILHPASDANARTFTIPANSSVAYPVGTAISFVNMTSQVLTIAITTDTMNLAVNGTTGSRSLAQYGTATALKINSTGWIISGSALT